MNTHRRSSFAVASLGGLFAIVACSSDRTSFDPSNEPAPFSDDAGSPAPACQGTRCSRDLKKVLHECDDGVVATCSADEGCGEGRCVDACKSAELSKGSSGCVFFTLPPDLAEGTQGSCLAAMIANTWDKPTAITAALGKDDLDITKATFTVKVEDGSPSYVPLDGRLAPGEVAIVFLSQRAGGTGQNFAACPRPAAFPDDPIRHDTARTRAFRLGTEVPVSAYSIYPYGGASAFTPTATLLLPVSSWTKNYLAINAWPYSARYPFIQIVAAEDDTEVRMLPRVDVYDGQGVVGGARGRPLAWTLARGEALQITQPEELTGSPIETSKPVGVFGGNQGPVVPDRAAADILHQQIPPLSQWGSEYALVPYRPRYAVGGAAAAAGLEQVPWRLVGAVDGTTLTFDPAPPGSAPLTLSAGEAVTFMTNKIVVVKSQDAQHPFYAAVYMTGAEYNRLRSGDETERGRALGDPDFVNVVPSDQYLDRYVFFADYTFPETTLTIVRRRTKSGFLPVELACAGELGDFQPLGTAGEYEFTWVSLTEGSLPKKVGKGECGYGRHEAKSEGPFAVTVWGTARYASYGYVGGMGLRPINDVTAPVVR